MLPGNTPLIAPSRHVPNVMAVPGRVPITEGIAVFIGVAAWDLLSEGRLDAAKALLIAGSCTLVWYAIRCWRDRPSCRDNRND